MRSLLCAAVLCLAPTLASAAATPTELTWFGHAAFQIKTPSGKVLLIDPWIDNPGNAAGKQALAGITKADLILVTHGHNDHVGNVNELGKRTGARLVSTFDLGQALVAAGFPPAQLGFDTQGNAGGTLDLLGGDVQVSFVPAVHGSQIELPAATKGGDSRLLPAGAAGGFLIHIKNGPTIYHTGDTDLFGDMSRLGKVDVMLVCIGDHFTMGPDRAAEAVKMVNPHTVVPMHFGTFPVLTGTPDAFAAALKKHGAKAKMMVLKMNEPTKF